MAYNPIPSSALTWGDPGNLIDFKAAHPGQWFLGVIDTHRKQVFLLPSDLEPPGAYEAKRLVSGGRYISMPMPSAPDDWWHSGPMAGLHCLGINSLANGVNEIGTLRQHARVVRVYGSKPEDCLGFGLIKFTESFGEFRDRSNTLNADPDKMGDQPRMSPSGRSFRMPMQWGEVLKHWLESN